MRPTTVHFALESDEEVREFQYLWFRALNTLEPPKRPQWALAVADKVDEIVKRIQEPPL